jgi:hypothetical protein
VHLTIVQLDALFVCLGGAWGDYCRTDLAQYLQQKPVVVFGVLVMTGRSGILLAVCVPLLLDFDGFPQVRFVQVKL